MKDRIKDASKLGVEVGIAILVAEAIIKGTKFAAKGVKKTLSKKKSSECLCDDCKCEETCDAPHVQIASDDETDTYEY